MEYTNQFIHAIDNVIEPERSILLCILFGSAATGSMYPGSDVDIAIAGVAPFEAEFVVELQLKLAKMIKHEVDILDLNRTRGLISRKIFESGKVIINRDHLLTERLIKKVVSYSADVLPFVLMILERRAMRFSRGS